MYKIKRYDIKLIGAINFVPIIIDTLLYVVCQYVLNGETNSYLTVEILIPYSSIWAGVFYAEEMICDNSVIEMLYASNKRIREVILVKYIKLSLIWSLIGILTAGLICLKFPLKTAAYFLILLFFECIAFNGMSYLLTTCTRNAGWVIALIMGIIVGDYGTQGRLFKKLHFSLYWYEDLNMDVILPRVLLTITISLVSYILGQVILNRTNAGRRLLKRNLLAFRTEQF